MKQLMLALAFLLSFPLSCPADDVEKAVARVFLRGGFEPAVYAEVIRDIPQGGSFADRWASIEKRLEGLSPKDLAKARSAAAKKILADEARRDAALALDALFKLEKPEAEAFARKALAADPDNVMAHMVLATVYLRKWHAMDPADKNSDQAGFELRENKLRNIAHDHALQITDRLPEGLDLSAKTAPDKFKAMAFLEDACRYGDAPACKELRKTRIRYGKECDQEMRLSPCSDEAWNACSKEAGDKTFAYKIPEAMLSLAKIHGGLCPGRENPVLATQLLEESAEKADSDLYCRIRVQQAKRLFQEGKYEEAVRDFANADKCSRRDPESFLYLALGYLEGKGVEKDEALGLRHLERAAAHGVPEANFLLARRLLAGSEKDFDRGFTLMRRAAAMKVPEAVHFLKYREKH